MDFNLSVRELTSSDVELITNYWLTATDELLWGMGADPAKIPPREFWVEMLNSQLGVTYAEKPSYATIWLVDGEPVGHCNVNKIVFGQEAYMHLSIWQAEKRQKGIGAELVKMSLPFFFENMQIQNLYCEPYAKNPGPNKTLAKAGFQFVKTWMTTPGFLNFEQEVNLWQMSRDQYKNL